MEDIKRTPGGQVINGTFEPQAQDMNPAGTPQGTGMPPIKFVDGKNGSVTKLDMVQTDHTDEHSGPAPIYEGPGDQVDGSSNG